MNDITIRNICALALASLLLLPSCNLPRLEPLSKLGPSKIGPVSLQASPKSDLRAHFSSLTGQKLNDFFVVPGWGVMLAIGAVNAEGSSALREAKSKAGSFEESIIVNLIRSELVSAGYQCSDDAPRAFLLKIDQLQLRETKGGAVFAGRVSGLLTDTDGSPMWMASSKVVKVPGHTFAEYKANPSLYRTDVTHLLRESGRMLVRADGIWAMKYSDYGALIGGAKRQF